jgi:hypothetical protein
VRKLRRDGPAQGIATFGGTGQVAKTQTYQVKPSGALKGSVCALPAVAAARAAAKRDLFLRVRLAKHPDFGWKIGPATAPTCSMGAHRHEHLSADT